jgi:acyl-CoA synthetase (AMP-forming)/AMP-acid ligase II
MGRKEVRVKMDVDTEDILRDANGFATQCGIKEAGEVVHHFDPQQPYAMFSGHYNNIGASENCFIKDLFKKGDLWFRSGDMMRVDENGLVYFVDRLGDTFRWKSESVSTNEVTDMLGKHHQVAEAKVYGVSVPNADRRCGCAVIVLADGESEDTFDLAGLASHALSSLPRYTVPIFIRSTPQLDYTGTLKLQKGRLKREGIDPEAVAK